ncbi:NAD-dependent epimerase/dehydratase family protein [Chryseobacterium geocarposphaerae]|uniref:Nucleoside-diphosphate-sugar epimerase n=1 Tax=Chryseobacterium geocarposphaerae TaxID=1416776 RepID=A0A2M9C8C0_9FLAO|nr:NAD-dependent epimerase/dehydratase family protein [Chryseobacterium geocarposphaerae]PJJ67085.1 nucleoside-diphosphate-sugar epimerase [Chryseobacterium geocarposphaerae]
MKKIFVTGITGLLGANVVIKLLEDGYFVIALVRKKSNYLGEKNKSLKLIEGDLFSDFSEYLKDVNFIIHIAAETKQNLLSYEGYRKVNYEGVVHLLSQSVNAEKFLFVSTANTLGFGSLDDLGTENDQWKYPFNESFYAKSKLEAENFLLENNKTKVIIVNPTFMIGAYDNKPSSGKIIFWVWKKKLVFYPKGGKNFVNAEDAAKGICKALEKGKPGEKYLLANENLKYKDFFKIVNNVTGQQSVLFLIPDFILIFLGFTGDFLRFIKIKTNLSSANMKALRIDNFYSNQKSINELGVHYQPIEKGITDAVEYFKNTTK